MRRKRSRGRSAFTLIEVLLVAGILAVLAAFIVPNLFGQATEAKRKIAIAAVLRNGSIGKALDAYRFDMSAYPTTDEGLAALFQPASKGKEDSRYKGPYMQGNFEELKDPWEKPYEYRSPGEINEDGYDLWSTGPDGKDDGGKEGSDDIKNWIEK
jgi:general secretion pathway protein G